ncbi:hypothetical protein CDAR_305821 [Caerostris darwini]|uniref:Uncharacterized protein n=1 Tax=Caerostris darwini TaxID=1538125 RepID=A0AAV4VTB2_9ARAC|nr:hypothetical protein CDAR_305821 [Caerostris darwini]
MDIPPNHLHKRDIRKNSNTNWGTTLNKHLIPGEKYENSNKKNGGVFEPHITCPGKETATMGAHRIDGSAESSSLCPTKDAVSCFTFLLISVHFGKMVIVSMSFCRRFL